MHHCFTFTFYVSSNFNSRRHSFSGLNRPKRLLVFINPYGGKRKGPSIYEEKVYPLFQSAGIEVDCVITQRANHAKDMLEDVNFCLKNYDGVVCVGGDGMFSELLNGLLIRTQKDAGIEQPSLKVPLITPTIPIGIIPAGSTDAVVFGTTGLNDPTTSAIQIILNNRISIDVCGIHTRDEDRFIRYATSFLAYGYFGDTLVDSEGNRWMGPRRYDWAGVKKFLRHKLYSGEIKLYVSTADGSPKDNSVCLTK